MQGSIPREPGQALPHAHHHLPPRQCQRNPCGAAWQRLASQPAWKGLAQAVPGWGIRQQTPGSQRQGHTWAQAPFSPPICGASARAQLRCRWLRAAE